MTGFLQDYLIAERVGHSHNQSCSESFPRCPLSLFDVFRSYGTNDHDDTINKINPADSKKNQEISENSMAWMSNNYQQNWIEKDLTSVPKKHPFGMEKSTY